MKYTAQDIGRLIRETRKGLGVTQKALALASGTRRCTRAWKIFRT
jgi:transcriptional regulator with XRE-family HTH domain